MNKDADPQPLPAVALALEGDDDLEEPTRPLRRSRSTAVLTIVPPLEDDDA